MERSLKKAFFSILGGQVGTLALSILFTPVLVRLIGSESYGQYAFFMSISSIALLVTDFGVFDGVRKYMAEERPTEDWESKIYIFYNLVIMVISIALITVFYITAPLLEDFVNIGLNRDPLIYLYMIILIVLTRLLFSVQRSSLMGIGAEHLSEPLKIAEKAIFCSSAIIFFLIVEDIYVILFAHSFATVIVAIVCSYFVFTNIEIKYKSLRGIFDLPISDLITYNVYSAIFILVMKSMYHVDIVLIGIIQEGNGLGFYKAALVIAEMIWFIPIAVETLLLHSTSELWSKNDVDRINSLSSTIFNYTFLLLGLAVVTTSIIAPSLLRIYFGSEFIAATGALLALLPGVFGFGLSRPIFSIGQGKGEYRVLILTTSIAASLNIILNVVLIPKYGIIGAAIATSVGYGSMIILHLYSAFKIGFNPVNDFKLLPSFATLALVFIVTYVVSRPLSGFGELIVAPMTALFVFSVLVVYTEIIDVNNIKNNLNIN